jgi:unsaturated chondroitin disaccharide hydrolase
MKRNYREVLQKIAEKERIVAERNKGRIPYTTRKGRFDDKLETNVSWWTNGFWGGFMWQLYTLDKSEIFRENAEFVEEQLDQTLMDYHALDHDNGFKWLQTSVGNYRQFKNEKSKNRAILAAGDLAGRFNTLGGFIRAWNDWGDDVDRRGWAIIDCMMNLPLLYWASEETGDPRYAQIAKAHADTTIANFIRGDGSSAHIVEFDYGNRRESKVLRRPGIRSGLVLDTRAGLGTIRNGLKLQAHERRTVSGVRQASRELLYCQHSG